MYIAVITRLFKMEVFEAISIYLNHFWKLFTAVAEKDTTPERVLALKTNIFYPKLMTLHLSPYELAILIIGCKWAQWYNSGLQSTQEVLFNEYIEFYALTRQLPSVEIY